MAAALVVALHLRHRRELLIAFLDATHIPHENGLIKDDLPSTPVPAETLKSGIEALKRFPAPQASAYLNVLWLQDPDRWGLLPGLAEAL